MASSEVEHIDALREMLREARADTTREVAGCLGSAIAKITWDTKDDATTRAALEAVRSTSLRLLEELTRDNDQSDARSVALQALDALDRVLPKPETPIPTEPESPVVIEPEEPIESLRFDPAKSTRRKFFGLMRPSTDSNTPG